MNYLSTCYVTGIDSRDMLCLFPYPCHKYVIRSLKSKDLCNIQIRSVDMNEYLDIQIYRILLFYVLTFEVVMKLLNNQRTYFDLQSQTHHMKYNDTLKQARHEQNYRQDKQLPCDINSLINPLRSYLS